MCVREVCVWCVWCVRERVCVLCVRECPDHVSVCERLKRLFFFFLLIHICTICEQPSCNCFGNTNV